MVCHLLYMYKQYVLIQLTWTAANKWDRYIATTCLCLFSQSCKHKITLHVAIRPSLSGVFLLFQPHPALLLMFSSPGAAGWVYQSYSAVPFVAQDYYDDEYWRRRRRWCPEVATELLRLLLVEKLPWTTRLSAKNHNRHQTCHQIILKGL